MFYIRQARKDDLDDLYQLSKLYTFINLPSDKAVISNLIDSSDKSFSLKKGSKDLSKDHYLFVLEDIKEGRVRGASMIHAQHGTEEEPHFYLKVGQEHKFSQTINTGFIHGTLKLGLETDGPTEIGGLILDPELRGNPFKLGKQLSFSRFLFMGMNPKKFKEEVHSELMPPFDSHGKSPLWEAIGRRFMNMDYPEADLLSRNNKEFILSLFPSANIYETLLPMEARNAIGKVGKDTQPVKKMLEQIGFKYIHEVDPFDGGPHYRCPMREITLIKNMISGQFSIKNESKKNSQQMLLGISDKDGFKAILCEVREAGKSYDCFSELLTELGISGKIEGSAIHLN
ncbi:MAG: arginine N-succinyltransferase [Deltaproteobacteria bacterium]|nr:MAG: arginine N-succinyltransferase [Deltaproteobacteria bacterium]TNF31207.1 MAG: arginine N-succinyltransferase [Deltaproteobacteria bacterium]